MSIPKWATAAFGVTMFAAGFVVRGIDVPVQAQTANRVFEMRTYTAAEGKLDALKARFRDHTIRSFNKFGMVSIGYWTPQAEQTTMPPNTIVYLLAHPSREAGLKAWASFNADPEWMKAKAASEANGPLVASAVRVWLDPADFSLIK